MAVAEDDDTLLGGMLQIGRQLLPLLGVDVLRLLDENEVHGRHHGVAFGIADDGSHRRVAPIDHRLVEVAHGGIDDLVLKVVAHHVDIVVLLPGEEVHGLEVARLQFVNQLFLSRCHGISEGL